MDKGFIAPVNILGTSEVAEYIGVSKQRIHALRKDSRFPQPFKMLASTPLWDAWEIHAFLTQWRPHRADQITREGETQ